MPGSRVIHVQLVQEDQHVRITGPSSKYIGRSLAPGGMSLLAQQHVDGVECLVAGGGAPAAEFSAALARSIRQFSSHGLHPDGSLPHRKVKTSRPPGDAVYVPRGNTRCPFSRAQPHNNNTVVSAMQDDAADPGQRPRVIGAPAGRLAARPWWEVPEAVAARAAAALPAVRSHGHCRHIILVAP